jgi:hypothetical protein
MPPSQDPLEPAGSPFRIPFKDPLSGSPLRIPSQDPLSGSPLRIPSQDPLSGSPLRIPSQDLLSGSPLRIPSQDSFQRSDWAYTVLAPQAILGGDDRKMADLGMTMGCYSAVSTLLNMFEVALPKGVPLPFPEPPTTRRD